MNLASIAACVLKKMLPLGWAVSLRSSTPLGVGADLAVVAGDEIEDARDTALVHGAESEGRGCFEQALLHVFPETDEALLEILRPGLPNLPDVEVDAAHGEHVVGEEGELVLAVGVVGLEGVPQKGDVVLLAAGFEGERQVVGEFGGFFHGRFIALDYATASR